MEALSSDPDERLLERLGEGLRFEEYWPAATSNITLTLNQGQVQPLAHIDKVERVRIKVTCVTPGLIDLSNWACT